MKSWLALYAGAFAVNVLLGWLTANGTLPTRHTDALADDLVRIVTGNARASCTLFLLSLSTFGVGGLVFFALNGFAVGLMLGMVTADKAVYLLLYAPLEFVGFILVGWAALQIVRSILQWCGGSQLRVPFDAVGNTLCAAAMWLAAAAVLEIAAILLAWGRG